MNYNKELEEKTGIFVFENAISEGLCEETILAFENSKNKKNGMTGGGYNPKIKNSLDWHIDNKKINEKFFDILRICYTKIEKKYFHLRDQSVFWGGLQMQKSFKNKGYFKKHTDNDESDLSASRWFAPIFYLNDVEIGGETNFPCQKIKIKSETGKLVIFPATWQYLHEGIVPKSHDKYIITTFGMIPRN